MRVALTGITGNMGQATLEEVLKIGEIDAFRLLVLPEDKRIKKLLKTHCADRRRIEVLVGNLKDAETCKKLVADADFVVNMAAVIPPLSDQNPQLAVDCNQIGAGNLVDAIEAAGEKQPKLVHVSTMALYGNRTSAHPWARVGDPLLVSPYDVYSATKLRGEFRVLESSIRNVAVLRQSAMLHKNMLSDNVSDGLMFHTCFNAPLEWVTAKDSGVLIANILRKDLAGELGREFWGQCFNIASVAENRVTGYDTLNDGFALIGGTGKDFFRPYYNSTRNFHGVWFSDGDRLEKLFHYQKQTTADYWREIARAHRVYKLAKMLPKRLIASCVIKRLFKSPNAPAYWAKHGDEARLIAYFGGRKNYEALPKTWENFPLLRENKDEQGNPLDYAALRDPAQAKLLDLGFDDAKADGEITRADLENVARLHGGALVSSEWSGDLYEKLEWKNRHGETFFAKPFTVLRAGHWFNRTYEENVWEFDGLAKKDRIYAQVWLDSHRAEENYRYGMDADFHAVIGEEKF